MRHSCSKTCATRAAFWCSKMLVASCVCSAIVSAKFKGSPSVFVLVLVFVLTPSTLISSKSVCSNFLELASFFTLAFRSAISMSFSVK